MAKVTNTTARTPLGIGSLGILIEPGQTVELTVEQLQKAGRSKVVRAWATSGMLTIEPEGDDKAEMARLAQEQKAAEEAEELRKLQEAEDAEKAEAERLAAEQKAAEEAAAKSNTLKVPTPTPKK